MQRTKEKNNMRIHPRLKENVELNPTKESSQENLDLLCQKIDSRVIINCQENHRYQQYQ